MAADTDRGRLAGAVVLLARLVLSFTAALVLFWASQVLAADGDLRLPRVVVAQGGPYICRDNYVHKFYDAIEIPEEYLKQPLSMVCTNGSEAAAGFSWVRLFLLPDKEDQEIQQQQEPLGRLLVNEDSFLSTPQIYLDMTAQLRPGRNNICIEAAGRPGAVCSWEIRSIGKPRLFMPPFSSAFAGTWLDVTGSGFSLRPDENTVLLGSGRLPVAQASAERLRVFIPAKQPGGCYDLSAAIRSYCSNTVKLQVLVPQNRQ